jgi:hypothetical protein
MHPRCAFRQVSLPPLNGASVDARGGRAKEYSLAVASGTRCRVLFLRTLGERRRAARVELNAFPMDRHAAKLC